VLLVFFLALLPLCVFYVRATRSHNPSDAAAEIYVDGELKETIPLEKKGSKTLLTPHGEMEIEYTKGKVRVVKSSCPGQICVRTGWISRSGSIVSCLPNRVLIKIIDTTGGNLDGITF
jgi:hypothetical protein